MTAQHHIQHDVQQLADVIRASRARQQPQASAAAPNSSETALSLKRTAWGQTCRVIAVALRMMRLTYTPKAMSPEPRLTAMAAMAMVLAGAAAMPATAQEVGWHPATSARPAMPAGIDPNTFIVGHPATPTTRSGHANAEHPAVQLARRGDRGNIDANAFIVQPPAAVTWIAMPLPDDAPRFALSSAQRGDAPEAR